MPADGTGTARIFWLKPHPDSTGDCQTDHRRPGRPSPVPGHHCFAQAVRRSSIRLAISVSISFRSLADICPELPTLLQAARHAAAIKQSVWSFMPIVLRKFFYQVARKFELGLLRGNVEHHRLNSLLDGRYLRAANDGRVLFSGNLGIYGEAIIIDRS